MLLHFFKTDAYWPGLLSMIGDIPNAMKSIYNYHSVWKQYGFLPEFYNSNFYLSNVSLLNIKNVIFVQFQIVRLVLIEKVTHFGQN